MSEQARSFHRAAVEYDRGRPGWPPAVLDLLPIDADATVLDLGAGTGKLTRLLADRYARVIALEPLDELRAILRERVPEADVRAGVAERIPLADAEVDAAFAGQSFHWFANDTALGEIARVLRPGGVLALMWNRSDGSSPLPDGYRRRIAELHDEGRPPPIDQQILERFPFGEEHEAVVPHVQRSSREEVLAFAASVSWIAGRDDREQILDELGALLPPGNYVFPLRTEVTWAMRA
jgi:SAM-dependent methyltransferase